jgi:hypothetical protein
VWNVASHSPFNTRANLQQKMGAALAPPHLLLFHHPLAHHLVHSRCDKAGADALAVAIPLAIVGNKARIVPDVRVELLHGFQELPCGAIAARRHGDLQIHDRRLDHLQGLIDLAMPQKPFQPFEWPPHRLPLCFHVAPIDPHRDGAIGHR